MVKLLKIALGASLLLALIGSAAGQEIPPAPDWDVLFYDSTQILVVNSAGIAGSIPLPLDAQNLANPSRYTLQLSPDRRWLAFIPSAGGAPQIADLQTQSCCIAVTPPDSETPDTIRLGAFSPDSALLAVLYLYPPSTPTHNQVTIVDAASGLPRRTAAPGDLVGAGGDVVAVDIGGWDASGLLALPACINCDSAPSGFFTAWNPQTDAVTPSTQYRSLFGDVLPATGELLDAWINPARPVESVQVLYGPFNAIRYTTLNNPDGGTEVFFDPNNLNLPTPRWVMDGNAYLLHRWGDTISTLVFRDGTVRSMDYGVRLRFLVGTPDGWLMSNLDTGALVLYQWQDGQLGANDLGLHATDIWTLAAPDLGTTATGDVTPVDLNP